jgi:hypothetical protein
MPILFEEVTGEISSPDQSRSSKPPNDGLAREKHSALEREVSLRRQLDLLAERERRCRAD